MVKSFNVSSVEIKSDKLASPIRRLTVNSSQLTFVPIHSRDIKTWPNIKNPAQTNLDIVPKFKNQWSVASSHCKWRRKHKTARFWRARGWISNFEGLVTLTLDWVILHTVMHHSSTSTYMPNFIEIKSTFCGRTHVRMYICTDRRHLRPALLGRLWRVDLKMDFPDITTHRGSYGPARG